MSKSEQLISLEFPLQLGSALPEFLVNEPEKFIPPIAIKEGMCQAYELLVSSMAENNVEDLTDLVEYNFLTKLRNSLRILKEKHDYHIKLVGDIEDCEVFLIYSMYVSGSILPYRNLNFPQEEYLVSSMQSTGLTNNTHYVVKTDLDLPKSFRDLTDLDLKSLNESFNEFPKENILKLFTLMNVFPLLIEVLDIGILTSRKLRILDKANKLVAGNPSSTAREFHSIRIENVLSTRGWLPKLLLWKVGYTQFMSSNFSSMLDQYTVVDLDGYLTGNLIIPNN